MLMAPSGAAHVPVPALHVIHIAPDSTVAGVVRLSVAVVPVLPVQTHGVDVAAADCAACPSSRNKADEPPPRNLIVGTAVAFELLAIAQSAIVSTTKYFTNLIFPPQFELLSAQRMIRPGGLSS